MEIDFSSGTYRLELEGDVDLQDIGQVRTWSLDGSKGRSWMPLNAAMFAIDVPEERALVELVFREGVHEPVPGHVSQPSVFVVAQKPRSEGDNLRLRIGEGAFHVSSPESGLLREPQLELLRIGGSSFGRDRSRGPAVRVSIASGGVDFPFLPPDSSYLLRWYREDGSRGERVIDCVSSGKVSVPLE